MLDNVDALLLLTVHHIFSFLVPELNIVCITIVFQANSTEFCC